MSKKREMEEQKQLVLNRYQWSEKWRRPWDDKWLRWYKAVRSVVPKLPKGEEDRSNLFIPYTYSTMDTVRSKLMTALFERKPYIAYIPKDEDDVENANNMETLVDTQMEKGSAYVKFFTLMTDMLVYGVCPFETGWRYQTKTIKKRVPQLVNDILTGYDISEEEVVLWDDPDFQPFMIDELYPDPDGVDIDDSIWVIRKRFLTEKDLREKEKQGIYKISDWDEIKAGLEKVNRGKQDRLASIGASHEINVNQSDVGGRRYELLEMWQDDKVVSVVNQVQVIRDEYNPFWHGKKPFGLAKMDPLNGEFYGISLVELIEHLQAELNTTRNQRIDSNSIAINRMWKVLKGANIEPADLVSRPNGIVWVDQMDDVKELEYKPLDPSAFQEEAITKQDIQEATATYSEARGASTDSKRTATENAIRDRSVSMRFEVKVKLFEHFGLKRLGMFFDQLNQQFIDDIRKVRVPVEGGYDWKEFGPTDIAGQYEYQPAGTAVEATLDALNFRENLLMLHREFKDDPEIKTRELKKRIIEAYGIKDTESILKTEEEMAQEQQEAVMMLQQQQMLQQTPQAGNPNANPLAGGGGVAI